MLLCVSLMLISCFPTQDCYLNNHYKNITHCQINITDYTDQGIAIDMSGFNINLKEIDRRIDAIEQCFSEVSGYEEKIKRECLTIKVVVPILSQCSDQQMVPVKAPDEFCNNKGITPTKECPCLWRTAIQDNTTIVTPPVMYLWEIGRIHFGNNNIWESEYAKCLNL